MMWLDKLIGIDRPGIEGLKAEVQALRQEVASLAQRDYLLQKIEQLEKRLTDMDRPKNAAPDAGESDLKPAKEPGRLEKAWAHFEDQVDEKVVRWVFFAFVLLILLPAAQLWWKAPTGRDFPEYLSYVFPIAAAIAAGLTAYREDRKGRYFLGSLFLLFMGVDAFIAAHPHQEKIVLVLNGVAAVAMFAILTLAMVRSTRSAWKMTEGDKKRSRLPNAAGVLIANGVLWYFGVFSVQYASAVYVRDKPCLSSDPKDLSLCPSSVYPNLFEIYSLRQNLKVIWSDLDPFAKSPH